ncbi:MAG: DUF6616 family protein [Bacteroidota bacterium]
MYLYVELWNVTESWMKLSKDKRREFFDKMELGVKEIMDSGAEVTGWAMNDEHTPYRSDYRYMAVWKLPSIDDVEKLEKAVADSGWHTYFSQVNARGEMIPMPKVIEKLINIEAHSTSIIE